MTARIVCVGNRWSHADALGPRVFDHLAAREVPAGVELVDGGLAGLGLLAVVEGCERVVFVDAISAVDRGSGEDGVVVIERPGASRAAALGDHGGGFAYLLGVIERACQPPPGAYWLVGAWGVADDARVAQVAALALALAVRGPTTTERAASAREA